MFIAHVIIRLNTVDSRWLELRSLEVLDLLKFVHGPDFFLCITKQIYSWSFELPISRSKYIVPLCVINAKLLLITRSGHVHASVAWFTPVWQHLSSSRRRCTYLCNGMFIQVTLHGDFETITHMTYKHPIYDRTLIIWKHVLIFDNDFNYETRL